jgi:hypothetical protein
MNADQTSWLAAFLQCAQVTTCLQTIVHNISTLVLVIVEYSPAGAFEKTHNSDEGAPVLMMVNRQKYLSQSLFEFVNDAPVQGHMMQLLQC